MPVHDAAGPGAPGESLWPGLAAALRAAGRVDRVELKVRLHNRDPHAVLDALDVDRSAAQVRQVYFVDTPDLSLSRCGVLVRARRIDRTGDDVVVKLRRPITSSSGPFTQYDALVEVDATPTSFMRSDGVKARFGPGTIAATVAGEVPPGRLLTTAQRSFLDRLVSGADVDRLTVLGSVDTVRLPLRWSDGPSATVDVWSYADGSRILELSCKCRPARAESTAARASMVLADRRVPLAGTQGTKADAFLRSVSRRR